MWKKILLGIIVLIFLVTSLGMIGWIGFHEKLRLTVKALQRESDAQSNDHSQASLSFDTDHSVIENKAEALFVLDELQKQSQELRSDNLPEY